MTDDYKKCIELGDILGKAAKNDYIYHYTFVIRFFLGKFIVLAAIYFLIRIFNANISAVIYNKSFDWSYYYYLFGFTVSSFINISLTLSDYVLYRIHYSLYMDLTGFDGG